MKRVLLALFTVLILVACGNKIHENISKEMVEDTRAIIKIIDDSIKNDSEFTEREEKKLHSYQVKFGALKDNSDLTEEEGRLFILANRLIDDYDYYAYLESDEDYLKETKEYIDKVITTGKMYDE